MSNKIYELNTIEENECGLKFYPRPQLKRSIEEGYYLNLNGSWEYAITKEFNINDLNKLDFNEIIVPYPIESKLSKVNTRLNKEDFLVYKKEFSFNNKLSNVILHIGAIDQESWIYLNGKLVKENIGGYLPIDIDITNLMIDNNTLVILCSDTLKANYPYGKQKKNNGGMWYTPVSGIWKSVWLESVDKNYIKNIKLIPDYDKKSLELNIDCEYENVYNILIKFNNNVIKELTCNSNKINIEFEEIFGWSPDSPNLYSIYIKTNTDYIESYFGFRKISIDKVNDKLVFLLNNKPIFMHGLLDQGYYPESLLSYPSIECVETELIKIKDLGFNTLRKHIKIEEDIWYYLCDKLGIIVWQDFVNMFKYSFMGDSALPAVSNLFKKINRIRFYKKCDKEYFINHSLKTIDLLYNHPSICLWTIFNEGWGQFNTNKVYKIVKKYDNTRLIDPASGWFDTCKNKEFVSLHVYFKKISIKKKYNIPVVISEFGGYAYKVKEHYYNEKLYGYKTYNDLNELNDNIYNLYKNEIIGNIKNGVCASIYTQVSDIEDEVNGIFTYDRKVTKLDSNIANKISEEINIEYNNYIGNKNE